MAVRTRDLFLAIFSGERIGTRKPVWPSITRSSPPVLAVMISARQPLAHGLLRHQGARLRQSRAGKTRRSCA